MSVLSSSPIPQQTDNQKRRVADSQSLQRKNLGLLDRWSKRAVLSMLERLNKGQLRLRERGEEYRFGRTTSQMTAELEVLDPRFYREIALGSSLGAGDAYVKGYWQSDDLLGLLQLFARHLSQKQDLQTIMLPLQAVGRLLLRWSNRNSRSGSRRNIEQHYDLSNDLFSLFLDPTMTYSCGFFPSESTTLEEASQEKYDVICRKLSLSDQDHVVEIGCGWGGFAEHAATHYGCRVTGITISKQQYAFAAQRIQRAGLSGLVELKLCDYRDLQGTYDKLVSIEMIEAVGHEYHETFFKKCGELLKPHGQMLLQAITIDDDRYDYYRRSVDFIQKYIFPGGCLPSLGRIAACASKTSDLRITRLEDRAADYARTLLAWRASFHEATETLEQLGFDERFRRTWEYYFCYCAAGFLEQQIGVAQILLERSGANQ